MQKLSDGELVLNYCISCMGFSSDNEDEVKRNMLLQTKLLSRLERGRIAIEAMEKIIEADSKEVESDEFDVQLYHIIDDYQQSCEEATDENF